MNKLYEENHIQDIANAIRNKNVSGTFTVAEMAPAIENISTGGSLNQGYILNDEDRSITFYGNVSSYNEVRLRSPYSYNKLGTGLSGVVDLTLFRGINDIRGYGDNKYHLSNFGIVEKIENNFDLSKVEYPFEGILLIDTLNAHNLFGGYRGSNQLTLLFRNIIDPEYLFNTGTASAMSCTSFANFSSLYTKVIDLNGEVIDMSTGIKPTFSSPLRSDRYLKLENMRIITNVQRTNLDIIRNILGQRGVSLSTTIQNYTGNAWLNLSRLNCFNGTLIVENGYRLNGVCISTYSFNQCVSYTDYDLDINNLKLSPSPNRSYYLKPWTFNNIILNGDFSVPSRFIEFPQGPYYTTTDVYYNENDIIPAEMITFNGTYNNLKRSMIWPYKNQSVQRNLEEVTDEIIEDVNVTINYNDGVTSFSRTYQCDRYLAVNYSKLNNNILWNIPYIDARENKLLPWFIYHVKE